MKHFGNEVTTIFYRIDEANSGQIMISVLTEDTDVFVLLVCWVYREDMECKMQMERVTVSAAAWHVRPQQLRHDIIFIRQSQDQFAKHLAP